MAQVGAASLRRVTRDRKTLSGRRGRRAIGGLPVCKYFSRCRVLTKLYHPSRGTEGSNPASSSGELGANFASSDKAERDLGQSDVDFRVERASRRGHYRGAYIDRADPPRSADKLSCSTRKIPPAATPALIPARQSADLAPREQYRGG